MTDEKMIEEIRKDICIGCSGKPCGEYCNKCIWIAEELIKHYQPKPLENAVVLTKEEYDDLLISKDYNYGYHNGEKNMEAFYEKIEIPKIRKETAREIIKWFRENSVCIPSDEEINEFAKQYGVEVEE